ncbi:MULTISPECIES: MMPL family transporter [unclassified Mycobacterium]|uniref:MMPL family transporter n=1 Tax=unclassified Mycobacterium TaxID=2642494 RepID=UPI0029C5FE7C|nr:MULTISPECIES: MMPL family transporter [unclassified Mycobacterium]
MSHPAHARTALQRIALHAIASPRRFLVIAALVTIAAGLFGVPVAKTLCACGFEDPTSQSATATKLMTDKFGQGDAQLLIIVSSPDGYQSGPARAVGTDIVEMLKRSPHVAAVSSVWTSPPQAAAELASKDGNSGLIVAGITGGEQKSQDYAKALSDVLVHDRDGVTVRAGGLAMVNAQITEQSQRDLFRMESLAIPLSFLVLVWVFGGLLAAAVPVAVGVMAVVGALAVLRGVTFFTDVSIFALNLSAAMGLALAIDYTLLMISRYRDELADGAGRDQALIRTMETAGRTVLFSATIVALSMAMMLVFPMHFLKSFAYAGVATVAFAALAALFVTPAAIVLCGDRLDALNIRRVLGKAGPPRLIEQQLLYRSTKLVMRRAAPVGVAVVALLLLLGAPFLGVKWGFPDDRVLPHTASAHQVGDQLRNEFVDNSATAVTVVIPNTAGLSAGDLDRYTSELSRVPDVSTVSPPTEARGSAYLTIYSTAPLFSDRSQDQLDRLHALPTPGDRPVLLTGTAQVNGDSVHAITSRLPVVLGLIAAVMFTLLFLLTGSVVMPVKALVLNLLSLTAAFGAMVWIFQEGHLGGLGTTATGTLVANIPVLLFCIAFGLSMDYEVFLVSRIREYWLASGKTGADSDGAVALGIARTGRVVTAAAVVMSISFAALIAAEVSFMRMFGLGLTLAVLADATLVRMVLMPAFMHVMGDWNWWAPKWLSRIHDRFGLDHGDGVKTRDHSIAGATKGARSELQGPLNEEVADVVSTLRRIP